MTNTTSTILYEGLDIQENREQRDNLLVVERLADYRSFFKVETILESQKGGSDHVPLLWNQFLSYNILCAGSPSGLIYESGEKYLEERDYDALNQRTSKNISHILQWVREGNFALIQELTLNRKAYIPGEPFLGQSYRETNNCRFSQATFYPKNQYDERGELSQQLQKIVDGLTYRYRPQQGRILTTILQETANSHPLIALVNMHLAPGGRAPVKQKHFREFMDVLILTVTQFMANHPCQRIIIAGDVNNDPFALWGVTIPHPWQGTLIYAPLSCQSYWGEDVHLSTNDLILEITN